MAYAPSTEKAIGEFVEDSHGRTFQYVALDEMALFPLAHGGKNVRYPHKLYVGERDWRYAYVKGKVAHVVVDETELGWKVERWVIRKHRVYAKGS